MQVWLDIVGSFIISGTVMLMVITLNTQMQTSSRELVKSTYGQASAIAISEIIEADFYRIGNRVTGEKISVADSTRFLFYGDIDNNSVIDSVLYYTGTPASINKVHEIPLYRKVNSSAAELVAVVSVLAFRYYDSLSFNLTPALLVTSGVRARIKTVQVALITRSPEYEDDTTYQATEWSKIIKPKNL